MKPETVREALLILLAQPEITKKELAKLDYEEGSFHLSSPFVGKIWDEVFTLEVPLTLVLDYEVDSWFDNKTVYPWRIVAILLPEHFHLTKIQIGSMKGTLKELWREGEGVPTVSPGVRCRLFTICNEEKLQNATAKVVIVRRYR